jgi:hypothetical protein
MRKAGLVMVMSLASFPIFRKRLFATEIVAQRLSPRLRRSLLRHPRLAQAGFSRLIERLPEHLAPSDRSAIVHPG